MSELNLNLYHCQANDSLEVMEKVIFIQIILTSAGQFAYTHNILLFSKLYRVSQKLDNVAIANTLQLEASRRHASAYPL